VIDGTGAPARADQTIVIRDGNIADRRRIARAFAEHRGELDERSRAMTIAHPTHLAYPTYATRPVARPA
jgi:hypothetical protein